MQLRFHMSGGSTHNGSYSLLSAILRTFSIRKNMGKYFDKNKEKKSA